jgi:DNA invertase Pin-like site-specific DNA recombinase
VRDFLRREVCGTSQILAAPAGGLLRGFDTTTPGGRLIFHLFGALGQFERDLIQERTRAGLAAAAVRGRKGGRKPVVDASKLDRARSMVAKGLTVRETATQLKIGKTALYEALRVAVGAGESTPRVTR